jgi:hypothetical protein
MSSLGRNALLEVPLYCAGMILPIINGSNQDVTTKAHYLCPNCSKIQQVIEFVSRSSDDATLEIVHQYESDWRTIDVPHHQTGHDLAQSLRNGCHLCSLLMDQLLENDDTSGDQFFELFLDQRVKNALAEEMKVELRIPTDPSVSWDNARLVINLTSEPELRSKTIGLGPSTS